MCGNEYEKKTGNHKFCSEKCSMEAQKRNEEQRRLNNIKLKKNDLDVMAREATEHGMTYGRYVAMIYSKANPSYRRTVGNEVKDGTTNNKSDRGSM